MVNTPSPRCCAVVFALALLAVSTTASARQSAQDWGIDPGVLADGGSALLRRAPDAAVDAIFQSVHAASHDDAQARVLCMLFDPDADRSLQRLNAVAAQLPQASRDRFADALANALVEALQSPPKAYDAGAALQSMKAAGATAAILHDGFVRGVNASGTDADSRAARCQSVRWLLDAMQARPLHERSAMTRWLLDEGLDRLAPAADVSGGAPGR
jgi:hypothetical protein